MKIRIIDDEKLLSDGTYCDMLVCAFAHKTVYYKKELSGETEHLKTLAKITENADNTIVCPFDTNNYGIIKKSAGVFDRGKLLGISDMSVAYADTPYMPGKGGTLYDAKCCKLAAAAGDDLYSYDLLRSYAVCGAELIVIAAKKPSETDGIVLRAYSFLLGLPLILVFVGGAMATDAKGNLVANVKGSGEIEIQTVAEYNLKITRTRFNK